MAEQQNEGEVSAPPVVPIVLTVTGAIAALWWLLRRTKLADRPIIMTGGSLHVWGLGGPIQWVGQVGEHHVYENPIGSPLQMVNVKPRGNNPPTVTMPKRVEIWFDPSASLPDVVLSGTALGIRTESDERPLKYDSSVHEVNDDFDYPGEGKKVPAEHQYWDGGTYIGKVAVTDRNGDIYAYYGAAMDRLRLKIKYRP